MSIRDKTGEALKLLLTKGFDPNVRDREKGNSPLHLAVNNSNEVVVRILTQHTACDVNLQVCFPLNLSRRRRVSWVSPKLEGQLVVAFQKGLPLFVAMQEWVIF
mgnify:FL=1